MWKMVAIPVYDPEYIRPPPRALCVRRASALFSSFRMRLISHTRFPIMGRRLSGTRHGPVFLPTASPKSLEHPPTLPTSRCWYASCFTAGLRPRARTDPAALQTDENYFGQEHSPLHADAS